MGYSEVGAIRSFDPKTLGEVSLKTPATDPFYVDYRQAADEALVPLTGGSPWAMYIDDKTTPPLSMEPREGLCMYGAGVCRLYPGVIDPVLAAIGGFSLTAQTDGGYIECEVKSNAAQGGIIQIVGFRIDGLAKETGTLSGTDHYGFAMNFDEVDYRFGVKSKLNNAGAVDERGSNATLAADDTWYKLKLQVNADGTTSAWVDDVAQAGLTAFTFDSGDVLVPVIEFGGIATKKVYVRNVKVVAL